MSSANMITSDINFNNMFGDISFSGTDISKTYISIQTVREVVLDRLKTNLGDYVFYNFGANLDQFLGKGMGSELTEDIKYSIRYCLTYDNFMSNDMIDIIVIPIDHKYIIRIILNINNQNINIDINNTKGVLHIG